MITVRRYSPEYRDGVRRVCIETAYFGEHLNKWLDIHPDLFADFFTRYYTDFEPEGLQVALNGNILVGYMALCSNLERQKRIMKQVIVPDIMLKIITGRYSLGRKVFVVALRMITDHLRYGPLNLEPAGYNADIHINFLPDYIAQYRVWGEMVINGYDYLIKRGVRYIKGVLLQRWENPEDKMNLLGFKPLQIRETTIVNGSKAQFLITGCDLWEWREKLPRAIRIFTRRDKMK
ncbi:MAG TPA: hypothetical protein ENG29_00785 [Firmicutes bacterium]|nr:MAG: hypothetical protein DRH51_07520 [Candidatus Coatesbacteria bacterium]RLC42215.1 MAG: hypothetical protein DRH44_06610 [Candidatus Coatesbacteria bacterium]RLC42443.1 MAG: hypothetical protein DRH49_03830 [Candidatus Coatesbacteria bacterium]HDM42905.1 hypothetical protein [Bacillota bacterium]